MEIIEQIGSYAGLAAVLGLGVLSALYFSQARDVKRLREWAGRAPERAPGAYQGHRVVAQPVQQPPPAVPPRAPVPPGAAPAQAAAAGAGPAVATGPHAATPAAARAAEAAAGTDERPAVPQNTVAHPPPLRPPPPTLPPRQTPPGLGGHFAREAHIAQAREEAERLEGEEIEGEELEHEQVDDDHAEEGESEEFDAQDGEPQDEGGLPDDEEFHDGEDSGPEETGDEPALVTAPAPPPPPMTASRAPLPPRPAPPSSRPPQRPPPILPPYERSRPGGGPSASRSSSPAKAALAVAGIVVVVGAAAFGVLQLTGNDEAPSEPAAGGSPAGEQAESPRKPRARGTVNPRTVTVSVLNGTTVGGLAAQLGDKLEGQGFQLGNVTNNTDQQRAESVVLFAPGAEKEARDVGRRLKIDQREPIDPDSQTRAGDARVVVVAGADLNQ